MNKLYCLLLFITTLGFAQTEVKVADSLFREDQFYISVSYNLLQNKPANFSQFSFSSGFTAGFLRDFPISKNRHWSLAPGLGYAYNNLKQNINMCSINSFNFWNFNSTTCIF